MQFGRGHLIAFLILQILFILALARFAESVDKCTASVEVIQDAYKDQLAKRGADGVRHKQEVNKLTRQLQEKQ